MLRSLPGGGLAYSIQWAAKKVCSKITGKQFELSRKKYIQDKNNQLKTEIESYAGKTTQEQKDNVMRIAKVRRRYDVAQTLCTGLGVAGLFFPPLLIPSIVGALITNVMKRAYDPGAIACSLVATGLAQVAKKTVTKLRLNQVK